MDENLPEETDQGLTGFLLLHHLVMVYCYRSDTGIDREERMVRLTKSGHILARVKVVKMNLDRNPKLNRQYRPQSLPTLLFFINGHMVVKTPFYSTVQLRRAIEDRLHKAKSK